MEFKHFQTKGCCGKQSYFYKIDKSIDKELSNKFIDLGLKSADHLEAAGIMYVYNSEYIMTGPFGSNKLQFKCKLKDCSELRLKVENILKNI